MPSADESYRFLAAKYVRKQAKQLAAHLDGVHTAEDIESIHQARVASRRLRAAMGMFCDCFDAKQLKKWRKQIRRVTTSLGDARDQDVQIEFLRGVLDALEEKACYPGIVRFLVKLEQRRERLQPKVIKAADRLEASGVLEEMRTVTKQILSDAKAQEVSVQSPFVFGQTGRHILHNLEAMLPYQDSLADPEDQERHHAMRIAAKRLRYTVEISKPVYGGQLDGTLDAIKKVQTLLGEVHDCDVWIEHLRTFAGKERARILRRFGHAGAFARLQLGTEYLQQDRRKHRQQVFRELVDYWQELDRQRQWEKLVNMVRAQGGQSAVPELPAEATSKTTPMPAPRPNKSKAHGVRENSTREPCSGAEQFSEPQQQVKLTADTVTQEALGQ